LFSVTLLAGTPGWPGGQVVFPGLAPDKRYAVRPAGPSGAHALPAREGGPPWTADEGLVLTGRVLALHGLATPPMRFEQAYFVEFAEVPE
jgi:alpha-galactosidase